VDQGGGATIETEDPADSYAPPEGWREWPSRSVGTRGRGAGAGREPGAAHSWAGSGIAPTIALFRTGSRGRRRHIWRSKSGYGRGRQGAKNTAANGRTLLSVALLAGIVGGLAGAGLVAVRGSGNSAVVQVTVVHGSPGPALADGSSIPAIVSKTLSSVVTITATGPSASVLGGGTSSLDEGTGMIIDDEGDILTNNHVVAGSVAVSVTLHGQLQPVSASVVGTDPSQDIALIRITDAPPGLVPVIFGDSDSLEVGDAVIAIGDALGLSAGTPTVTSGIVSALGRTVPATNANVSSATVPGSTESGSTGSSGAPSTESAPLVDMIQTDAPINPGNSGGPLLDSAGRVVGMNTALESSNADETPAQDIGFAIPAVRLVGALKSLEKGATPGKAMLGLQVISNTAELQNQYGLAVANGAVVVSVVSGSPADQAGIKLGDVIVRFDSRDVTSSEDLQSDVESAQPGEQITVELWRLKHEITVRATLESSTAAG
jgi:S1-C subfamily serine protease